jgi:ABC-type multidrug transport system permease subunit
MSSRLADTTATALLAGLSYLLTAFVVGVPIRVLFIAWASFFAAGGGVDGALTA